MSGSNRHIARQSSHDNYETPAWAVRALLRREPLYGRVLEPCCGPGAIVREIERIDPDVDVTACDYREGTRIAGFGGVDFTAPIDNGLRGSFDFVITNPPFKLAEKMVSNALFVARKRVYFFQRSAWMEGGARFRNVWSCTPLRKVLVFVNRVDCYPEGEITFKKGMYCFAWYCWEIGYTGAPELAWIDDSPSLVHDKRVGIE